jgi:hypothetical protein
MDIPTAFMAVHVRTGEHFDPGDAANTGIAQVMEELGIPNNADLERGIDEFGFSIFGTVDFPMEVRSVILGGLVAGALWRKANEKRLTVVTDEMVDRALVKLEGNDDAAGMLADPILGKFLRDGMRDVLEDIFKGPVTDPPTGDGAEASS